MMYIQYSMYEAVKKLMLKKRTTSHGFILRQILSCSNARFLSKNGTQITPLSKGSQSPSAVYSHFQTSVFIPMVNSEAQLTIFFARFYKSQKEWQNMPSIIRKVQHLNTVKTLFKKSFKKGKSDVMTHTYNSSATEAGRPLRCSRPPFCISIY